MTSRETQTAHKHRRPTKRDFEGKTIKRFSRTADNIWRFWFTDGSSFAIQSDLFYGLTLHGSLRKVRIHMTEMQAAGPRDYVAERELVAVRDLALENARLSARVVALTNVLGAARLKLIRYRDTSSSEYVGAQEYQSLMRDIDAALARSREAG